MTFHCKEVLLLTVFWIGFLMEILLFSLFRDFSNDFYNAAAIICINLFFVGIGIRKYGKNLRGILFSAYILRLFAMLWDIYAKSIFVFPGSEGDPEGFFYSAYIISKDLSLLRSNIYGGAYSKILGILFYFTGPQRLLGQYLNILLGLGVIIMIYKILCLLDIHEKIIKLSVCIISFMPNAVIFSGILVRENFVCMFLAISFFYFVKWYKSGHFLDTAASLLFLTFACPFHSGVIGIAAGYIFMFMFYRKNSKKFLFSRTTVLTFVFFVIIGFFMFTKLNDLFLDKFTGVEEISDIYNIANSRRGGSAYLRGLKTNSGIRLVLYSPIRMFYFLASPLPSDWRGFEDAISFFVDASVYLVLIFCSFAYYKKYKAGSPIVTALLIIIFTVVLIFGIGVSNAGTAMRHRHKILLFFIILFAITDNYRFKGGAHDKTEKDHRNRIHNNGNFLIQ